MIAPGEIPGEKGVTLDKEVFFNIVEKVRKSGLQFKDYPNTYQINVTDTDGVIQSYYASTGTAVFRDGNSKYTAQRHTEKGMKLERFLSFCKGEEDIIANFFA